ncbi:22082_t:CDS:1, partial [Entrophospora sp. SA101]
MTSTTISTTSSAPNLNSSSASSLKKTSFKPVYFLVNENISLETISTTSSTTTPSSPSFTSTSTSSHPISSALSTTTTANNNIKISHIYPPRSFLWFPILTIQENITQKSTSAFNLRKRNEFKVNNDKLSFRPQLLRMKFVQNSVQSNLILNSTVKKNNKSTTMSTSTATTADTTTTKSNVTNELLITSPATPTHQISTSTLHYPRPHRNINAINNYNHTNYNKKSQLFVDTDISRNNNYLNHLSSPSPIHMNTNDDDRINDD